MKRASTIRMASNVLAVRFGRSGVGERVLANSDDDRSGTRNSRVTIGHTDGGRILKVIYVPDPPPDSVFVVTAYQVTGKPLVAFRRGMKKKRKSEHEIDFQKVGTRL